MAIASSFGRWLVFVVHKIPSRGATFTKESSLSIWTILPKAPRSSIKGLFIVCPLHKHRVSGLCSLKATPITSMEVLDSQLLKKQTSFKSSKAVILPLMQANQSHINQNHS